MDGLSAVVSVLYVAIDCQINFCSGYTSQVPARWALNLAAELQGMICMALTPLKLSAEYLCG